ncbi:MAG: ATP-binding protein [Saprospiraceae bacterium]
MNPELLRLQERVEIALEIGESYYREFKTALEGPPGNKKARDAKDVCQDIAKTLVAFANADGGELFIGVEDDNLVTGIPYNEEKTDLILKAPTTHVHPDTPLPIKRATIINYNGIRVAYFSVEKGARYVHLTAKGECFQRKDRESEPTSSEHIRFIREEQESREYDRQFVDMADVTDLDMHLVQQVANNIAKSMSAEKFLQYMELAEFDGDRLRLRRAALLLFAKNVQKWHPRCSVRILRVRGTEEKTGFDFNVQELAEPVFNIFLLVEVSWEALRPHLAETRFSEDAIFKTQIIYPEMACREALINAITHRDYSIEGRSIEIRIFDDRLEVLSPGKLLSSITIKDLEELKGVHQTRNTYIARVLREYGYIRELGEGIRRMYELMEDNELAPPKIESPNKSFIVSLFYKHYYSKEEKQWLDQFEHLNLSREQKTVVRLGIDGKLISAKQIWESVGIVDTDNFRQLIESLREKSILSTDLGKEEAKKIAKKNGLSQKSIPRYRITPLFETKPAQKGLKILGKIPKRPTSSQNRIKMDDASDYTKIFVAGLDYSITDAQLESYFSQFGEVVDATVSLDRNTKKSRGFGSVEFQSKEAAEKLLNDNTPKFLSGRKLYLQAYKKF